MEARFYSVTDGRNVKCELCPHNCNIKNGESGICKVRVNKEGILTSENYGVVSSLGFDPIEKKPLYHFYPGAEILSVGSLGCNLQCKFCQNWEISQSSCGDYTRNYKLYEPTEIIELALSKQNNVGIAYTYNEPTIFFEFVLDIAKKSRDFGLKNVMVTNGFINQEPLNELNKCIDAYSVDLKSFEDSFFLKYTRSKLAPVKDALRNIADAGKHLEITNLVIPTLNDDVTKFEEMVRWINENLGDTVVFHISRYYPTFELSIEPTPIEKMIELKKIADKYLKYVFLGNVNMPEGNNSYCPACAKLLISRKAYTTEVLSVSKNGDCIHCGHHILDYVN